MTVPTTPIQKQADLRIQRALAKPGAYGMKGFLLWTEAAWPKAIADKIVQAASAYTPGAAGSIGAATLASPQNGGFGALQAGNFFRRGRFGRLGRFGLGDDSGFLSDVSVSVPDISSVTSDAIASANDPSVPPVSGTTAATSSQPASTSWLSDVGGAITAATTAYLGAQQVKDAQSIFNINLQRAQQGLAPIPTNPTTYGLPAPTANIGLTSSTQTMLLVVAGVLGIALLGGGLAAGKRK